MDCCTFCGNKNLVETTTQYTYKRDAKYLVVEGVPCIQCTYCGEAYFHARDLKKIEREFDAIHSCGKKTAREVVVPVERFLEISAG